MSKQIEALKLALEAMEDMLSGDLTPYQASKTITSIKKALAEQPAHVAAINTSSERVDKTEENVHEKPAQQLEHVIDCPRCGHCCPQPAQPSKPWVGLSTVELDEIDAPIRERGHATVAEIYRAIEAKLREKNT